MPDRWYLALCRILSRVYYHRVRVVDAREAASAREARRGATLYVGLHRNGAVDGLIYKRVFPRATFLISSQLTRSLFGRIFFTGIPVTRANDAGDRSLNALSLDRCAAHLVAGGELFVLPEGTSDLGPRHLPFKPGVSRILERALSAGVRVTVVPVGIFYSAADALRSDVTVVRGPDVDTCLPNGLDAQARASLLMSRITASLETIGVNVSTHDELARIECMAALIAEGPGDAYYAALKALERASVPNSIASAWNSVEIGVEQGHIATEHGVPVLSRRGAFWNLAWLFAQSMLVGASVIVNAPVVAAAWVAGRRLADARNTIALWRLLIGTPVAALWLATLITSATLNGRASWLVAYGIITVAGLLAYPELRARWPRVKNLRCAGQLATVLDVVSPWVRSQVTNNG